MLDLNSNAQSDAPVYVPPKRRLHWGSILLTLLAVCGFAAYVWWRFQTHPIWTVAFAAMALLVYGFNLYRHQAVLLMILIMVPLTLGWLWYNHELTPASAAIVAIGLPVYFVIRTMMSPYSWGEQKVADYPNHGKHSDF